MLLTNRTDTAVLTAVKRESVNYSLYEHINVCIILETMEFVNCFFEKIQNYLYPS